MSHTIRHNGRYCLECECGKEVEVQVEVQTPRKHRAIIEAIRQILEVADAEK